MGNLLGEGDPGPRGSRDPGLVSEAPGQDPGRDDDGSGGGGDHVEVVGVAVTEVERKNVGLSKEKKILGFMNLNYID